MSTVLYRRPARRPPPAMPRGEVLFEQPPELPEAKAGGQLQRIFGILPMLGGVGAMAFMFGMGGMGNMTGGMQTMRMLSGGMMAIAMFGTMITNMAGGGKGGERNREINNSRRDYLRYLAQLRSKVRQNANRQREGLEFRFPDPDSLWALPLCRRLWERRPSDKDFSHVRLARGTQQFVMKLVPPETKPVEDLDPVSAGALRRFVETYRRVPDIPVSMALRGFAQVRFDGEPEVSRSLARAMVAHLACFHAPHELMMAFCIGPENRAQWDWVKWLPHVLHPTMTDGAGHVRLVASSLSELEHALADEVKQRPGFNGAGNPLTDQPHVVIVIDGGHAAHDSRLLQSPVQGVTILDLSGNAVRRRGEGVLQLDVDVDELAYLTPTPDGMDVNRTVLGVPDQLEVVQAESLARQLAPMRSAPAAGVQTEDPTQEAGTVEATQEYELELMSLLGIDDATSLDLETVWKPRPNRDRLRIPFGLTPDSQPIELDIKESAQGGMGPHGLVIGATGSGKSEVLRTLVVGMVAVHSPDALNFVLVDFKGGATFLGLGDLPHVSAVITNLEGELTLVDRMRDAINGEMNRRQEVLRIAGNYGSLRDYEEARAKGATDPEGRPLDPLPSLWIVCDEFSELLSAKPEFINDFVAVGRLGRSLGVHLLLASQRLEEGKLKGLDTHLSYRIGLRTFSAGESRIVLGVPDAFELPREPGHGYLKVGTDALQRFKACYVGAPYFRKSAGGGAAKPPPKPGERRWVPQITAYTTDFVQPNIVEVPAEPEPEVASETTPVAKSAGNGEGKVLTDLVVEQLIGKGRPAHQVWLPPLDEPPTLDGLLPPLQVSEEFGLHAAWEGRGSLQAPVALVDRPYYQRRDPLWLDLSSGSGNVAIGGGPQAGKSTMVRSLITAYALTHTPEEVGFYCLDFGGGTLPAMLELPHVGSVSTRLDEDGIRRTVGEMRQLIFDRERTFTEQGIDSIGTYRRLRRERRVEPDRFPSDVFLVVDGWGSVRTDHEAIEEPINEIAARGLGFGVHLVLTVIKWSELRLKIKDLIQTRLELKLGDPNDSTIDRKVAVNVPANRPGRGLTADKLHFLGGLPRIDGRQDDSDMADGVKAMIEQVKAAWRGQPAAPVRRLPERLDPATMPDPATTAKVGIPLGIDEDELKPFFLYANEEPHLFIMGENECGKSNLLEVIVRGIKSQYTPKQAKLLIIDYRRSLLDLAEGDHVLGYAASSEAATDLCKRTAAAIRKRKPGTDVTPDQLRNRSWWSGSDVFVIVDDHDLTGSRQANPLSQFSDLMGQAQDIGLHVVIARSVNGAARAMMDPLISAIRDGGSPALIMSGNRSEGRVWGDYRPQQLPPGRAMLLSRKVGNKFVQTTCYREPSEEQ